MIKPGYEAAISLPSSTDIKRVKLHAHSPLYEFMFSPGTIVPLSLFDTTLKEWLTVAKNKTRFWTCDMPITKANKKHYFSTLFR